jgi:hypothetical protein
MLVRSLLFALAVPALLALASGCSDSATPSVATLAQPTLIRAFPDASDEEESSPTGSAAASANETDAAASPPAALSAELHGNALCGASQTSCYPDDVIDACDLSLDGGTGGADASGEFTAGCHVVTADSPPVCLPGGGGMKNSTCTGPTQCAAGHECVGSGFCHRYCCSGNSECAVNEFCDVQPTTQNQTLVPVCMPELPCVLLDNETCPSNQQCGVVKDDGSTSCVAVGTARAGDSCEKNHCELGLLCLGAEGTRQCATLCFKGTANACKASQKCVGALPLFLTPTVGVCQ